MTEAPVKGHTKRPWRKAKDRAAVIEGPYGDICRFNPTETTEADRDLVLHSVNSLPALKKALEEANGLIEELRDNLGDEDLKRVEIARVQLIIDTALAALNPEQGERG